MEMKRGLLRDHKGDPSMGRLLALLSTLSGLSMGWYATVRGMITGVDLVVLILTLVGTATAGKVAGKMVELRSK